MLIHLAIRDLAVVDTAELDMQPGFTALTGETGAGKSILVGALALAAGERADSAQVRSGAHQADITACFEIPSSAILPSWANEYDLGRECIMRRVIRADGRSRGSLNGVPVPAQRLREMGACLIDICGQKSHQALLHTGAQLEILDEYGGLTEAVKDYSACYAALRESERECETLTARSAERAARLDLLNAWIGELEALDPQAGELENLNRQRLRLANRARMAAGMAGALERLRESEPAAGSLLASARQELESIAEYEPGLGEAARLLSESEVLVEEAVGAIQRLGMDLEEGGGDLDEIEQRRHALLSVARKHGKNPGELPALAGEFKSAKEKLVTLDGQLSQAKETRKALRKEVDKRAAALTQARAASAQQFAQEVSERMQGLAMEGGRLSVRINETPAPGGRGRDRVEFQVALNPGQTARPLARCASGGELARIGLAIQLAATGARQPPTMIFDEVDSGIGGRVAEIVGAGLAELGRHGQVLCVTHLPQVASQASQQIRVSKRVHDGGTRTLSAQLDRGERVREVARMLGGLEITPRTLAHAEEMLARGRVWQTSGSVGLQHGVEARGK